MEEKEFKDIKINYVQWFITISEHILKLKQYRENLALPLRKDHW